MWLMIGNRIPIANPRMNTPVNFWFFFSAEFLIGAVITAFFALLNLVKSLLPKPPRDLDGDVVLIAGVTSTFGEVLAEELAGNGCTVICVDNDFRSAREIAARLKSRQRDLPEEIGPGHRKSKTTQHTRMSASAYECDLFDCNDIRRVARKVENEIGGIDMLVTCIEQSSEDAFDRVSMNLKANYWTALAFLPYMLRRDRAHIVGIAPTTSTCDGYLFMKAGIFSLMENLDYEFRGHGSHLTVLSITPKVADGATRRSVRQAVKEAVQAIRRDQCSIRNNWSSRMLYRVSCVIYSAITAATQWLHTQGCDYSS